MSFDQKEELRLRMAELEKRLAKSEEERCKLEKTCNVLMRAFREEEKMQYKALNKKYEKFLEDCSVRKRRNDIILRSLCRIEDRSRALFAKTERLKLLKDRYISYLKISDVKKEEIYSEPFRTLPLFPSSEKITNASKLVQWKTPLATHLERERFRQTEGDLLARLTEGSFEKFEREKKERQEGRKAWEINVYKNETCNVEGPVRSSSARDESNPVQARIDFNVRQSNFLPKQIESEKLARNQINPEYRVSDNHALSGEEVLKEREIIGHSEAIERMKEISCEGVIGSITTVEEGDTYGRDIEYFGQSRKIATSPQNNSNVSLFLGTNQNLLTSTPNYNDENEESPSKNKDFDTRADSQPEHPEGGPENDSKPLPMGLDGVDYQNETYPESYYEQPVHHHNHTSIASDVILEEDETEQELDDEMKDVTPDHGYREPGPNELETGSGHESTPWASSPGHGAPDEPRWESGTNKEMSESDKGPFVNGQAFDEVKSQKSHSEQSSEAKQSEEKEKSERVATDRSDKNKTMSKSNLFQLLESDSESFQIEHGDVVSGNEDSDFDFSFNQN